MWKTRNNWMKMKKGKEKIFKQRKVEVHVKEEKNKKILKWRGFHTRWINEQREHGCKY